VGDSSERYPHHPPVPLFAESDPYEFAVRSQAGAEGVLRELGALDEIREAVLGHCEQYRRARLAPPYQPQLLKERLQPYGWIPEVRVPPLNPKLDDRPIYERYDMLKFFLRDGGEVGVAIEMDNWMVHRDLLKFRRGFERGQIAVGVIIQPNYYNTHYCYEHFRPLNEPLFGEIPILYCCPRGPGLKEPTVRKRRGKPFLMPKQMT
jgi:hypothetical protein